MSERINSRRKIRYSALLLAAPLFIFPSSSAAQSQPAPPPPQTPAAQDQQPVVVIKKESKLVLVDAVVTDKKGNYIHDLTQNDFKVFEDNKQQQVSTFSSGADSASPGNGQRHYLVLFFDDSTMATPDQIQARAAATKFIAENAAPDRVMAVVDFGGTLRIVQNFTANADLLQAAVSGIKPSSVNPNSAGPGAPVAMASAGLLPGAMASTGMASGGFFSLNNPEADFGARSMLLAVRSLAKNLRSIPGRKMVVLFSGGFPVTTENESELTATIDACNKANVAVYALDVRGLKAPVPGGSARMSRQPGKTRAASLRSAPPRSSTRPRLLLAAFPAGAMPDPQRPGGGGGGGVGGGGGGGGRPGGGGGGGTGGGGTGGGAGAGGGRGGTGGTGGSGGSRGGSGGAGGTSGGGGTRGGGSGYGGNGYNPSSNYYNSLYTQPRTIVPTFPSSVATNQQILAALAEGTGGFTIFNTNDLLSGLERIAREQNEFYILGYVPPDSPEGSCHTLKVKLDRGGVNVRSRSGYCDVKPANVLEGKPIEKQLESRAASSLPGSIQGAIELPYFYTSPDTARVNLAMDIPPDAFHFEKEKGKYHANLNVLGIAYKPDGSIGAKFSDTVDLDLEKDEWKQFEKTPYHYENQFDAASGAYKLTVVLSAGADAFGKFESSLSIDPYDGKHFSLGGVAMTNSVQPLNSIPESLDSALLEDRTPLVVKGEQIIPSGNNRFKRSDNVIIYTEVYEPLLTSASPPQVGVGYRIFDRATNKEMFFTGVVKADEFIQKGSPVIPVGLYVRAKDLKPGSYTLLVQAVDSAGNHAPNRAVAFDLTD